MREPLIRLESGRSYRLRLLGTAATYELTCLVLAIDSGVAELQTDAGRVLSVPLSAIDKRSVAAITTTAPSAKPALLGPAEASNKQHTDCASMSVADKRQPATTSERVFKEHFEGKADNISGLALGQMATSIAIDATLPTRVREATAAALEALAVQFQEIHYERKEDAHIRAHELVAKMGRTLRDGSGHAIPDYFWPLLDQLENACEANQVGFHKHADVLLDFLELADVERVVVDHNEFWLTVAIGTPAGNAPVEQVTLHIHHSVDARAVGTAPFIKQLRGGQRKEMLQRVRVTDLAIGVGEVELQLTLRCRKMNGELVETPARRHIIRLADGSSFAAISNPYTHYSGGSPVEDSSMFFGRQELLARLVEQLTTAPIGQCVVLYGQKRSGKSSVLRQLEKRLAAPVLAVPVTLGAIDTREAERSFIQLCIDEIYNKLVYDFDLLDTLKQGWPSDRAVTAAPMESFRKVLRTVPRLLARKSGYKQQARVVLLIDEFTYIFEYLTEGLVTPAFMRQWKALLQTRMFSAVIVGQDSMPAFKRAYPNEFGVTSDDRLTYLDMSEARDLADRPLRHRGASRYRGDSLRRLVDLTAGSPFYLQMICDQLVRRLNREKSEVVTESLLSSVVDELLIGPNALTLDKFDPLITAAGESVAQHTRTEYLETLQRLATLTSEGPTPVASLVRDAGEGEVLSDLVAREVVGLDRDKRCGLRVELFAQWLRANDLRG